MNYDTKFDAKLAIWTLDDRLGRLALPYDLVLEKHVGDERTSTTTWQENHFQWQVKKGCDGSVEDAIAALCDSLGAQTAQSIAALSENGSNWVVIGLLDQDFIEIHVPQELQTEMAKYNLSLSIENRFRSV